MSDLTLFDSADVRPSDPDTSHAAAFQIITTKNRDCMTVLSTLVELGGRATAFEITERLNEPRSRRWKENVIAKRCSNLKDNRYIVDSGERRPGSTDRLVIVWTPTALGRRTVQNESAGL